jgi:hypothetical protein
MSKATTHVPTFVLVGHCGADSYSISHAVKRAVPEAEIAHAGDLETARRYADAGAILLVNRVLDTGFGTDSGVELIAALANRQPRPTLVLVSNFADAQQAAVAAGAQPGFGKSDLGFPRTTELLSSLAAAASPALK